MKSGIGAVMGLALLAVGCSSVGLGGGGTTERDVLALRVSSGTTADALGTRLQQGGYEFALISTPNDSAWLATAATRAGLQMTRPGRVGDATYVFFGPKPVGDTTHTVAVQGGGQVRLHDALYRVGDRAVDLILARFDGVTDLSRGVRALLGYVGSDVSNNAALLLAIETPTQQFGDSVAVLLRAAYSDTRECADGQTAATSAIRLFYGPEARVRCETAQILQETGAPVSAQFVLP